MKKIGLIVNPVAGMGGSVGLKKTDDKMHNTVRDRLYSFLNLFPAHRHPIYKSLVKLADKVP